MESMSACPDGSLVEGRLGGSVGERGGARGRKEMECDADLSDRFYWALSFRSGPDVFWN